MVLEFLGSETVTRYEWVIIFYAALILLIIAIRKRFEWHGIVGLYKTKAGLRLMERWGKKHRELVKLLGYIGLGIGFVGMAYISGTIVWGLYTLISNPAAPPVVTPVLPGVPIPGAAIQVPLIIGWLALFVVIVIHEFSHGVVSQAHGIPVKSSGLMVFGVFGGAFVEPDEEKLKKQEDTVQYSLFAAGPFSNILTGLIFLAIAVFAIAPLINATTAPAGVAVDSVTPDYPMANASIEPGTVIMSVNEEPVTDYAELSAALESVAPGDKVAIGTDRGDYTLTAVQNPTNATRGYLGFVPTNVRSPAPLYAVLEWLFDFFKWLVILSFGLGLANLLPLGPVDGGRMLQVACRRIAGNPKRGDWWWKKISLAALVLILVLLFVPIGRAIF